MSPATLSIKMQTVVCPPQKTATRLGRRSKFLVATRPRFPPPRRHAPPIQRAIIAALGLPDGSKRWRRGAIGAAGDTSGLPSTAVIPSDDTEAPHCHSIGTTRRPHILHVQAIIHKHTGRHEKRAGKSVHSLSALSCVTLSHFLFTHA